MGYQEYELPKAMSQTIFNKTDAKL